MDHWLNESIPISQPWITEVAGWHRFDMSIGFQQIEEETARP